MKKIILFAVMAICLASCEKSVVFDDSKSGNNDPIPSWAEKKLFVFTINGDFETAIFNAPKTRGTLTADGTEMTDLWVFDYLDGECVQMVHQSAGESGWGKPQMALSYGSHHIYFVASRGENPYVDEDENIITWEKAKDTFWKDYSVEVVSTSNGNRAVTLDRVATKLKIIITDEVPEGLATISITPDKWYYGLDYISGNAVSSRKMARVIDVPASKIGTTGLSASIFGISGQDEWTTSVSVVAQTSDGTTLGSAKITGAPFRRNRSTEYTGALFSSGGGFDVSLSDGWDTPVTGQW